MRCNDLLADDLDGSAAEWTVRFGLDGALYEIDLSDVNAARMRAALSPFVAAGRMTGKTGSGSGRVRASRAHIPDGGRGYPGVLRLAGAILRQYREAKGYTLEDVAGFLGCDRSKVSRFETGKRDIRSRELCKLFREYGTDDQERAVLEILVSARPGGGWWHEHVGVMPSWVQEWPVMESAAAQTLTYDPVRVPALLQTPRYAEALAQAADGTGSGWDPPAGVNTARLQRVLDGPGRLDAVIGEEALMQDTGGPGCMREQAAWLAQCGGPRVSIRVLPSSDANPVPQQPVSIVRFGGRPDGPGAARLHGPTGITLTDPLAVTAHECMFWRLTSAALTLDETQQMLAERAASRS